jgi:biopolymer transport protein ExbD
MTSRIAQLKAHIGPNMTPMVDVVMCILIFFMLGSTFLAPELFLTSNMPQALGTSDSSPNTDLAKLSRWTLSLQRQGDATWLSAPDGTLLKMNRIDDLDQSASARVQAFIQAKRAALSDDIHVIIAPTRTVPYQDVITVYDYCAAAKFRNVAFTPAQNDSAARTEPKTLSQDK